MTIYKRLAGNLVVETVGATDTVTFQGVTANAATVVINGNLSVSGNAALTGNISGDNIFNGTTSIAIPTASGNATVSIAGVSNTVVFTSTGTNVTGTLNVTNSTTTDALRITQTGAGNALVVEDSANPDATPFIVDANGFVIQGYTSGITGLGYQQAIEVLGQSGTVGQYRYSNDSAGTELVFVKSRSATTGTNTVVQSGDALAIIRFAGADGTAYVEAARIAGAIDGTPGTNDMPGRLVFSTTADGASTPTERMRIDSSGAVGIGTTPAAGVTLILGKNSTGAVNTNSLYNAYTVLSDVTTSASGFQTYAGTQATSFTLSNLYHYVATQGTIGAGSTVTNQYGFVAGSTLTGATNNYGFYSNLPSAANRWNFYAAGTARNYFAGNVGIGTNSPGNILDVTGSTYVSSNVTAGGSITVNGSGALGYATGSGGTVTQDTSRSNGVTINKTNGSITLVSAAGSASWQSFTVTNSTVAATDTIIVNQKSGADYYMILVTNISSGTFQITYATTGGTTTEQPVFNFAVIKATTS